jgi:hypothetical protein
MIVAPWRLELADGVPPAAVPGIHVFAEVERKTWMAGTSPAMTKFNN